MSTQNITYYVRLAHAYFEATTTDAEEQILRDFLAGSSDRHPDLEAARAVMGFAQVARRHSTPRSVHRSSWRKVGAAAAVILTLGYAAMSGYHHYTHPDCVAYVAGERSTDPQVVQQQMEFVLRATLTSPSGERTTSPTEQLHEVFSLLQ